ncbi:MAG: sigma-70 family RNA polymerase sigma factor [Verrucomicrobiota bacterium]|nr:sigma-70 family RNA polymerase sigma factor [Verrucomicrobiota bacterium]
MNEPKASDVTEILRTWTSGDEQAPERLMPFVYEELRRIARRHLSAERSDHTLQPTALVHEAYLRLVDQSRADWKNRAQFFGLAAQLMRRILIDHARAHHAAKRGGAAEHLSLDDLDISPKARASELLALDAALEDFAAIDSRKSRVVELRFFGGLSVEETAEVMSLNPATVRRDWTVAKAWLHRAIKGNVVAST